MPEHVPAFALRPMIEKQILDPRTFVILGDSEAALSAVDALRTSFTGRIVLVATSPFGKFENTDILTRKFDKLDKNQIYMVESDFLDRANAEVIVGDVTNIDLNDNKIRVRG